MRVIFLDKLKQELLSGKFEYYDCQFDYRSQTSFGMIDFGAILLELGIINPKLSFKMCDFSIQVTFSNKTLENGREVIFEFGNHAFDGSIFHSPITFVNCKFYNESNNNISFLPGVTNGYFIDTKFEKDLEMIGCIFKDWVSLTDNTEFKGKVTFNEVIFEKSFEISNVKFRKGVYFYSCQFFERFSLTNVIFEEGVYFGSMFRDHESTVFKGRSEFFCNVKKFLSFNRVKFDTVNFSNLKLNECDTEFIQSEFTNFGLFRNLNLNNFVFMSCDLTNCSFLDSNLGNVIFSACRFNLKNILDDRLLIGKNTDNFKKKSNWLWHHGEMDIYDFSESALLRQLKQFEIYFDRHKDYELSGEFYKKSLEIQGRDKSNLFKYIVLKAYSLFSEYGESYKRAFFIFCLTILIFSFIYLFSGVIYIDRDKNIPEFVIYYFNNDNIYNFFYDFAISFLYSLSNSLPIRKELDIVKAANGFTTLISYLQTAIQTIIATLFVFALRRKFKRD